jgi:hypothetical protein
MKVKSSFIKDVKYNNKTLTLTFEYQDKHGLRTYNSQYKFFGVPKGVADEIRYLADSKGVYFNKFIKDTYTSIRIY